MKKAIVSLGEFSSYLKTTIDYVYHERNRLRYVADIRNYDNALKHLESAILSLEVQKQILASKIKEAKQDETY